jgi:hypothetical protein
VFISANSFDQNNQIKVKNVEKKTISDKQRHECSTTRIVDATAIATSMDWSSLARDLREQQTLKENLNKKNAQRRKKRCT